MKKILTNKGISIIVCCYNSAARLPKTLEHLANQKVPAFINWEVILVNNNSSDKTVKVARELWDKYESPCNMKIVDEPNPGLSFARESGIGAAKFDILLFCDDDNWLASDYLDKGIEIMNNSDIGILGGLGIPQLEEGSIIPNWFETYKKHYAVGPQSKQSGDISTSRSYVYGAASFYRASCLQLLSENSFQNLLEDRKGGNVIGGGDVELCYNLVLAGFKIFYSSELVFHHFILSKRLSQEYLIELKRGHATAHDILNSYKRRIRNLPQKGYKRRIIEQINRFSFLFNYWNKLSSSIPLTIDDKCLYEFNKTLFIAFFSNLYRWVKLEKMIYKREFKSLKSEN